MFPAIMMSFSLSVGAAITERDGHSERTAVMTMKFVAVAMGKRG